MLKELIINYSPIEVRVALSCNGKLEDYMVERPNSGVRAGSICKGVLKSILPGIEAAFVNIGVDKNGFLCLADVVNPMVNEDDFKFNTDSGNSKNAISKNVITPSEKVNLKRGQEVLVQIVKESYGSKGPRLTSHISIAGRRLVFMPFGSGRGVSRNIKNSEERERLRQILKNLKTKAGIIARTAAQGCPEDLFHKELKRLINYWKKINQLYKKQNIYGILHKEETVLSRIARDYPLEDLNAVFIDSREGLREFNKYMKVFCPEQLHKVKFYKHQVPIFEEKGLEEQIDSLYSKYVSLKSGGYLIIDELESLVAIDVNTGSYTGKKSVEATVYKVNKEAAVEIARQIKLRSLGGIIIIDFIDMKISEHRKNVLNALQKSLENDKAKSDILSMSSLCLVEMTRQRIRKSLESVAHVGCPNCSGRGTIRSPVTMSIAIIRKIKYKLQNTRLKQLRVITNPDVASCLANEHREQITRLERRSRTRIWIESNPSFLSEQVEFVGR